MERVQHLFFFFSSYVLRDLALYFCVSAGAMPCERIHQSVFLAAGENSVQS